MVDSLEVAETLADPSSIADGSKEAAPKGPQSKGSWARLFALLLVLTIVGFSAPSLLLVVGAIIAVVMIHEGGHFFAARRLGMKTTEYFLGFGPKIWSFHRGEMEYGIKALPLGGYVKIVGMNEAEELSAEDNARAYRTQAPWKRAVVAGAGVGVQMILAVILAFGVLYIYGTPSTSKWSVDKLAVAASGKLPAQKAGLLPGDQVLSVDGATVRGAGGISSQLAIGQQSRIVVLRHGEKKTLYVTPVSSLAVRGEKIGTIKVPDATGKAVPVIGISVAPVVDHYGVVQSFTKSVSLVSSITVGTLSGVFHTFSPSGLTKYYHTVTNEKAAEKAAKTGDRPQSIVGITQTASKAEQRGAETFLVVLIVINVAIGVLNLLPIFPLDGGYIVVALYEWVRSRRGKAYYKANVKPFLAFSTAILAVLVFVVLSSVWLDIVHPITVWK